jgi:hypothetical protein
MPGAVPAAHPVAADSFWASPTTLTRLLKPTPKDYLAPNLPPEDPLTCPNAVPQTTVSLRGGTFPQLTGP